LVNIKQEFRGLANAAILIKQKYKNGEFMKTIISILFCVAALTGFPVKAQKCEVADPTGTPLNVRVKPMGRIIGKLRNGSIVYQEDFLYDSKGREWLKVGIYRGKEYRILGFVLRDFLSCE